MTSDYNRPNPFWWLYERTYDINERYKMLDERERELRRILRNARGVIEYTKASKENEHVYKELKRVRAKIKGKRHNNTKMIFAFLLVTMSGLLVHFNYKAKYKLDDVDVTNEC
ncbi:hypothetical protein [Staphylococcus capitis]|uniref:hypothetical protein n=1 Tax=Staphylococcus capitis TaxID=29388 RepID=UPI002DB8E7A7|nr:hypothetical protein [Staphylococcus capitis]MEB5628450.1 hypothetical protein [Staphylococcus capitis]